MKKLILFAAILFAGVTIVNAQSKGTYDASGHEVVTEGVANKEANTKLKVTLNPIQSVLVNTSLVHLEYTTIDDYKNGVKTDYIADHLNVYSTGSYSIGVKYKTTRDSHEDHTATNLMFESIEVEALDSAEKSRGKISLLTEDQNIISSTEGGVDMMFKVDYRGKGGNDYLNYVTKGEVRTYEAEVIYTITAL